MDDRTSWSQLVLDEPTRAQTETCSSMTSNANFCSVFEGYCLTLRARAVLASMYQWV